MPLQVLPVTVSDFPRVASVEKEAFKDHPFSHILFPGPFPDGMLEYRAKELADQAVGNSTSRWLKVVDTDLSDAGEGIAFAKWDIYADEPPDFNRRRTFGDGCNIEACDAVFGGLQKQNLKFVKDRRCVYLHILITHPDHQRRGAAGLLVKWGIEEAKVHKLPLYVQSTPNGHALYKKYGFQDLDLHEVDFSKYGMSEPHQNWLMMFEPNYDI